jgi:hypothetical protein
VTCNISVAKLPFMDYAIMDRSQLILSLGNSIATSITAVYDSILHHSPKVMSFNQVHLYTELVAQKLFVDAFGGITRTKFIMLTSNSDYRNDHNIDWVCNMTKLVRSIRNYPLTNTPELEKVLVRIQEQYHIYSTSEETEEQKKAKRSLVDADLQNRLNSVIEGNAQLQNAISRLKKEAGQQKKKQIDLKIQCSRLEDELMLKDEQIADATNQITEFKQKLSEKIGTHNYINQKTISIQNKNKELEWHIVNLLQKEVDFAYPETARPKNSKTRNRNRFNEKIQRLPGKKMCWILEQRSTF